MNFSSLTYFLKVAEKEHMTRAAEELHITQPALSRAISAMEEELGTELFERDGKKIRLNESGMILKDSAERILSELDSLKQQLEDTQNGVSGAIRIGSSFPGREPDLVQSCILEFMERYPNVAVNYLQCSATKLMKDLADHQIDIAITSIPIHSDKIRWQELFTEKLGVLISKQHPLAAKQVLHIEELRDERFFCNNSNSDTQDLTQEFCRRAGFEPTIFFQGFFPELIGQAVSQGKGVSFLAESRFQRDQESAQRYSWQKNLTFRPVAEDYCCRTCGIAYMNKGYHSKAMTIFHGFFCRYVSDHHTNWGQK